MVPPIVKVATDRLTGALLAIAARGERTHCNNPAIHYLWLSEHDNERAEPSLSRDHCPVLTVCRDTAEQCDRTLGRMGRGGLVGQTWTEVSA